MKKIFLAVALLLMFSSPSWAANRYVRTAGGNYSTAATWASTSGGTDSVAVPTSADDVFLDANSGQLTVDAASAAKSVNCTGYTGTLTHNAFVWTVAGSVTFVSGMTYTPLETSTVTLSATNTLTTAGKLFPLMILNTGITTTLADGLNFMASKVITLTLNGSSLTLNGQTVSGNSATKRVLIRTNTIGTTYTITNTTGTFANADFRDITLSAAADLSAITGLSGNCGGNSGITFTTAADQHWTSASGGNWSTSGNWTSRVPLPQDDVYFDNAFSASQTVTADMPRLGKSIDWTGASGTPAWSVNTEITCYGSVTWITGMTRSSWSNQLIYGGRGSFNIFTAGISQASGAIEAFGGTYTLLGAYTSVSIFTVSGGTLVDNGYSMSVTAFNSTNTNTRAITRSGTLTVTSTGTVYTHATATGLTLTDTGTILLSNVSATSKTFAGGGLTYNDLKIAGGGAGAVIITGANTFNRIYTDGGGTKSITLPGSTTTTILSGQGLGNATNVITFTASAGSATVSKAAGKVKWNYVSLTNIPSTGGAVFYAGINSTDGGGNTGWLFRNAPSSSGSVLGGIPIPL